MESFINFFSSTQFMPHGHCYLWRPDILWLNVVADALIALAYFSIPASLIVLVRRRKDLAFNWVFSLFALFIISCGTTHLFNIWTVWVPNYGLEGLLKLWTGLTSVVTAAALWFLMPKALTIPSTADLETVNSDLQKEIKDREKIRLELKKLNDELETRVNDRTVAITKLNEQLEAKIESHQQAKNEIQRLNRDLRDRIDEMQKIFNLAPVGIAVASDPECKLIRTNPFCAELLGIDLNENASLSVEGNRLPLKVTTPDGGEILESELPMQKAAATGEEVRAVEVDLVRQDGKIFNLYEYAVPLFDDAKKIRGCLGIFVDITERKAFEREVRQAKDLAEAANKAKSEFLANMSHEIRTPLNSVLGFSQLLCEGELDADEKAAFIETIERNGRALTQLIDDILDLSEVEAGYVSLDITSFSLSNLVNDLMLTLNKSALEKGLKFEMQKKGDLPKTIQSDPVRLRQILLNLVGNAIKFTHKGVVTVTIDTFTSTDKTEHFLRFVISDTGVGLTEAAKIRIFQPFAQADSSTTRKFGGTGLGLALTKKLALALGGNVELSVSHPEKGFTFSVWISLGEKIDAPVIEQEYDKVIPTTNKSEHTKPLAGYRILVAEDSPDNQNLISHLLKKSGATVQMVGNGQDAIERASNQSFDLIIMDLQMPILDGYQATIALRKNRYERPIVALTAHAMAGEKEKTKNAGFNDYLTKPINSANLLKALLALLKRQTV